MAVTKKSCFRLLVTLPNSHMNTKAHKGRRKHLPPTPPDPQLDSQSKRDLAAISGRDVHARTHRESVVDLSNQAVVAKIERDAEIELAKIQTTSKLKRDQIEHGTKRLRVIIAAVIFLIANGTIVA